MRNLGQAQQAAGDLAAAGASWQRALDILEGTGAADTRELSRAELRERIAEIDVIA